ncbi:MAG: hypothetical protein FVQ80_10580 [Planctomycetes bacterium]|nr:hypothetical protein [Planctomycetota bacterium]
MPFIKKQAPVACVLIVLLCFAFLTLKANAACPLGDLDSDCHVGFSDVRILMNQWLENTSGYANIDRINTADMLDFAYIAADWKKTGTQLAISEFLASNATINQDPNGNYDDWVEIYNYGNTPIDIAGMYLTDNLSNPTKWQVPDTNSAATTIEPNGYLLIWTDNETDEGILHASFKINKDNDTELALFHTDGVTIIDSVTFSQQYVDISFGRFPDSNGQHRFFGYPTPNAANDDAYLDNVADTKFNVDRGFYYSPFSVDITTTTAGATIRYTLDGTEPDDSSTQFSTSINIAATTCVRAKATKPGWEPTNIDTLTYILNATNDVNSLPVISIVGDPNKSLFEPHGVAAIVGGYYADGDANNAPYWHSSGIGSYNNPIQRGSLFERPVSIEYIEPSDNSGFQIDCGIRIAGSSYHRERYTRGNDWSDNYDKISFKFFFRSRYGNNKLQYQLFDNTTLDEFKSFIIRGGQQDVNDPFIKDELNRQLYSDMGQISSHGTVVNLFINGDYKSYYNPCERLDEDFFQSWYSSSLDWDVVTHRTTRNGDDIAFNELINYARNNDLSDPNHYQEVATRLDITAFVDYLILQLYISNADWPTNNWTAAAEKSPSGIFRFYPWDTESAMQSWIDINSTGFDSYPFWEPGGGQGLDGEEAPIPWLYRALKVNADFQNLFDTRVQLHFFSSGALTDANVLARFNELKNKMLGVLPAMDTYIPDTFIPQRRAIILQKFEDEGLYNN